MHALGCFRSLSNVKQAEAYAQKADIRQSKGELNMIRKLVLAFVGLGAAGVVAIYLLTIPLLRRLPKPGRVSMDGITTIDDAVEACRRTHLHGWDLVALNEAWDTASNRPLR